MASFHLEANLLIFLVAATQGIINNYTDKDLYGLFKGSSIIHDAIDRAPLSILHARFPREIVNFGNEIGVMDTLVPPLLYWNDTEEGASDDSLYTVVFADIDDEKYHLLLWMVTNVLRNDVAKGRHVVKYQYPNPPPPKAVDPHRMLLLVYRQPTKRKLKFNKFHLLGKKANRSLFHVTTFQRFFNFSKFAIAGNFFYQPALFGPYYPNNPPSWMVPFIQKGEVFRHVLGPQVDEIPNAGWLRRRSAKLFSKRRNINR